MNMLTPHHPVRSAISATPSAVMALAFFATWIEPEAVGENILGYFSALMMLEFITIHSAAFMGWALFAGKNVFVKSATVLGLGAFYSIFVFLFAPSGEWWPLGAFWLLVLQRLFSGLSGETSEWEKKQKMTLAWGWSVFWYVLVIAFTTMIPLPSLGWRAEYRDTLMNTGPHLWFEDPQSLLAAGCIYFTAVASFEVFHRRIAKNFHDPSGAIRRNR